MDSAGTIERFLAEVRRTLARRAAVRVGLYAGTAALGCLLVAALWAAQQGPAWGSWGGSLTILALVGCAAAFAYLGWLRPRRRWSSDKRVARFVGDRAPTLGSDLLSAVELHREGQARHSQELVGALTDSTAQRLVPLAPSELVPPTGRRPGAIFATAVGLATAVLLLTNARAGLANLLIAPAPSPFGGAIVSSQPLVTDLAISLTYPEYTGRAPIELPAASGDFRVLPGTTVELRGRPAVPATRVQLVFSGDQPPISTALSDGEISTGFTVTEPTEYRFLLESSSGERRVESRPREIEIDPDRPPTVELHTPADELDVAELRRIELAYVAEDDFGLSKLELVWSQNGEEESKALELSAPSPGSAQDKLLWDLTELELHPGSRVSYRLDVWDNDAITGPKRTSSKTFYLRVFSPREKHDELIASQEQLFENLVRLLGERLLVATGDIPAHRALLAKTTTLATQIGTLVAALEDDPLAHKKLLKQLLEVRKRLDTSAKRQQDVLGPKAAERPVPPTKALEKRLSAMDRKSTAQLEDDVMLLADWLDRQHVESLLAVGDEIEAHQERLKKLLEELKRTGSEEVRKELMREIRRLRRRLADLEAKHRTLPRDVMDQFVNADALAQMDESRDCLQEVAELIETGAVEQAELALQRCMDQQSKNRAELEQALAGLRGERFGDSQKNLDEVRSKLADIVKDQQELRDESEAMWKRYAEKVDEAAADISRDTRRKVDKLVKRLRKRVEKIPDKGLTPFSKEEKEVALRRLEDLERMLRRGDIAESLSQAREARTGLGAMEAEMNEHADRRGGWNRRTENAIEAIEAANKAAEKLVEELSRATPSPEEILSPSERKRMSRLGKRQRAIKRRADALSKRLGELSGELPGRTSEDLKRVFQRAGPHMSRAGRSMQKRDPSGARLESREAFKALQEGQKQLRKSARNVKSGGNKFRDDPVTIPGADAYKPPERFREDILDAMKKEDAPTGYEAVIKRYYEELIR